MDDYDYLLEAYINFWNNNEECVDEFDDDYSDDKYYVGQVVKWCTKKPRRDDTCEEYTRKLVKRVFRRLEDESFDDGDGYDWAEALCHYFFNNND